MWFLLPLLLALALAPSATACSVTGDFDGAGRLILADAVTREAWTMHSGPRLLAPCEGVANADYGDGLVAWTTVSGLHVWDVATGNVTDFAPIAGTTGPDGFRLGPYWGVSVWTGHVLWGDAVLDIHSGTWTMAGLPSRSVILADDGPIVGLSNQEKIPQYTIFDVSLNRTLVGPATPADLGLPADATLVAISEANLLFHHGSVAAFSEYNMTTGRVAPVVAPRGTPARTTEDGRILISNKWSRFSWDGGEVYYTGIRWGVAFDSEHEPNPTFSGVQDTDDGYVLIATGNVTMEWITAAYNLTESTRPFVAPETTPFVLERETAGLTAVAVLVIVAIAARRRMS